MKKKAIIISSIAAGGLIIAGLAVFLGIYIPTHNKYEEIYKKANEHLYKYEFDESEKLFKSIYTYRDSAAKIGVIHGIETLNETSNYNKAIEETVKTGGVIKVAFTSEGTPVDPITITTKTIIDAKSYMEHYDFLKWNILSYYLIENSHSFQLNLYSSFTPHIYSIDYDVGDGFVVDPVRSYTYGTSVTATNAYRDGYSFTGYTVGEDPTLYNPFVVHETDGQNFLLKAHYSPNSYTYYFNALDGTASQEEGTYVFDNTYLDLPTASKPGYQFTGWYTDYDKKLESKINIDENTTLYAHYTPVTYNINYELRGGQFLEPYPTGYDVTTEDLSIPYPHRNGYIFLGWVKQNQTNKNSEINYVIPTGSSGDITLHACWRAYTSDYGNSHIKALGEFDLPDVYPFDPSEYIPGYVLPYNIVSFKGNLFGDELIHSFGVEKMNTSFEVIGEHNEFLVSEDKIALYKMAFTSHTGSLNLNIADSITEIKEYAFAYAPIASVSSDYVINVREGAFAHSLIETVDLPCVAIYEKDAFIECHSLTDMDDSLQMATFIGESCFYNTHLNSVVVGDQVNYLGPLSFGGSADYHYLSYFECLSEELDSMVDVLKGQTGNISLKLGKATNSIKDIFGSTNVHLVNLELVGVEDIPDEFLYLIPDFDTLTDTVDIVTIGDRAFYGTKADLIPSLNEVTYIGESAFETCPDLGAITLEEIKYIGENAFKDSKLTSINLPESLEYIGDNAFAGCEYLEKLVISSISQFEVLGDLNRLFGMSTYAPKLDIEVRGAGTLPERAFEDLYVGRSVTLKEGVSLSNYAFSNVSSIQYVTFDHSCNTIIPTGCFENAYKLKEIDITGIVHIKPYAFNNCISLQTIIDQANGSNTLGEGLNKVDDHAFANITKIDCLSIKNASIQFGEAVFANDAFEIDLYNGSTLNATNLIDFQGAIMIMP